MFSINLIANLFSQYFDRFSFITVECWSDKYVSPSIVARPQYYVELGKSLSATITIGNRKKKKEKNFKGHSVVKFCKFSDCCATVIAKHRKYRKEVKETTTMQQCTFEH